MVRRGILIIGLFAFGGCVHQSPPKAEPVVVIYEDQPATALAYAPPIADYSLPMDEVLDRTSRQPRAYVGYQSTVREFFWTRTDDRFRFGPGAEDRFERRAISARFGVIER